MVKHNRGAEIVNESAKWGQIAVQGPRAMELASRVFGLDVKSIPSFEFRPMAFAGDMVLVARTGYTGEDGVEVFVPSDKTVELWRDLMNLGADLGVDAHWAGRARYSAHGNEISALRP